MSLFEWIAERFNPGPVGRVRSTSEAETWHPRNRVVVWLLTVAGTAFAGLFAWGIVASDDPLAWILACAVYLLLAWWLSPQPNSSNMGWAGGLLENPFRISDDYNRFLFWAALFLLPGKLVLYAAQTIVNTIRAFRS